MPAPDQCPSHTRTPWGTSPHRLRPSLRHLAMGLLLFAFIAVVVLVLVFVIGHSTFWADHEDRKLEGAPAAGGIAFVMNGHGHEKRGGLGGHACVEKLQGCVAEDRSILCCPRGMICQNNIFSPSEISCCPPSTSCDLDNPPSCIEGTSACPAYVGGGCCPDRSTCALEGCPTEFLAAPRLESDGEDDEESVVKAKIPTFVEEEAATRIRDGEWATHTGPKFGEVAIVLDDNYQENIFKTEDATQYFATDESDEGMVVKAAASDTSVDIGEEEEESNVNFVKGKGSRGSRRSRHSSSSSDSLRKWINYQPSSVPLPRWVSVVMPAVVVDMIFLLR